MASGELSAPIVIGRDHPDSGSVASPNRETEAMKDDSDAMAIPFLREKRLSARSDLVFLNGSLYDGSKC